MENLVSLTLRTRLGACYVFPDMARSEVELLLRRIEDAAKSGQLTLVNASQAVLILPFRIIKTISVGEEERWCSPA